MSRYSRSLYIGCALSSALLLWILFPAVVDVCGFNKPPRDCASDIGNIHAVSLNDSGLSFCHDLNELELAADKIIALHGDLNVNAVADFEHALGEWRTSRAGPQPDCRTRSLGTKLCTLGQQLLQDKPDIEKDANKSFWNEMMYELALHESTPTDCEHFHEFVKRAWRPAVFSWLNCDFHHQRISELLSDPLYNSVYAKAAHQSLYGPPEVSMQIVDENIFRKKRVQNLNYLRLLKAVMPDFHLGESVDQIIEFGGGSGELPAAFFDLGFRGTHFVLDLPPMNLLHWYWLRYSGIPAYVGNDLEASPEKPKGRIILESSAEGSPFFRHVDPNAFDRSLFFATYSYTEADHDTRERFRTTLSNCGIVFVVFWPTFLGYDNDAFIDGILKDNLLETHFVQIWKHENVGFYLVARKKALGQVLCLAEWNCHWYTRHFTIPNGGLRRIFFIVGGIFSGLCMFALGFYKHDSIRVHAA